VRKKEILYRTWNKTRNKNRV